MTMRDFFVYMMVVGMMLIFFAFALLYRMRAKPKQNNSFWQFLLVTGGVMLIGGACLLVLTV